MKTSGRRISLSTKRASTSLPVDSPANLIASPANDLEKKMSDTSGQACLEQFGRSGHAGLWQKMFSALLVGMTGWSSRRCNLTWKLKATRFSRSYFQLQASTPRTAGKGSGLLPTVVASDGTRSGEIVTGRSKTRPSGMTYSSALSDLAKSGLLPTPTTGSNRNSRNAIQKIGNAHQDHGVSLGLAQVMEISTGILPKEFDSWEQVPAFYMRLLPTPVASDATTGAIIGKNDRFKMTKGLPRKINQNGKDGSLGLARLAHFLPTPTAQDFKRRGSNSKQQGLSNTENWIDFLPTLAAANDTKGGARSDPIKQDGTFANAIPVASRTRGNTSQLNPLFVMEMMGFPCDWTVLPFQSGAPKA